MTDPVTEAIARGDAVGRVLISHRDAVIYHLSAILLIAGPEGLKACGPVPPAPLKPPSRPSAGSRSRFARDPRPPEPDECGRGEMSRALSDLTDDLILNAVKAGGYRARAMEYPRRAAVLLPMAAKFSRRVTELAAQIPPLATGSAE